MLMGNSRLEPYTTARQRVSSARESTAQHASMAAQANAKCTHSPTHPHPLPCTPCPSQTPASQVEWATLQQEEVAALVDWCLQMPREWALTPLLKDRVLQAVSAQISGHHQK